LITEKSGQIILVNFGKENQFYVNPVKLLKTPNHLFNKTKMKIYSSTNIRKLISSGNVKLAKNFLGNNFSITSKVIKGDQRGRKIGVPTANLNINEYVAPKYGVYAIEASFLKNSKKRTLKGIANFGIRPTFHKNTEILEVHLFRFKLNIYNSLLKVDFVEFIRHEKKFSGVEALKKQLKSDISKAQKILN
jgi:riboflavin kinase/FMN adenylyltransferase